MQAELDSLGKNIMKTWTILDDLNSVLENTDEDGNYTGQIANTTSATLIKSIMVLYGVHFEDLYKSYEKIVEAAVSIDWIPPTEPH
jgi:hypothetical protein